VPFSAAIEPITATDEEIRAALEQAELPALLPALAHLTGDRALLREDLRPDPLLMMEPQSGLTAEQQASIRAVALQVLVGWRDSGGPIAPRPSPTALQELMEFAVGGVEMAEYVPLLEEELGVTDGDRRAPSWRKEDVAPDVPFTVAVIGAGMSGLLAAHRLQQAGVPFVVLEKNEDVGGTWWENTYPGCRVDNPNHLYSYSFAQKHDWPQHFSTQDVLHEYFRSCADELRLRPSIRFGTEVRSATFDEDRCSWTVVSRDRDGREEAIEVQAVISAVGQLNRPNVPDLPGRDTFAGPAFHSARWDHSVDLTGKRVAVIGTGASAAQLIPIVAEQAAELDIFQRTPNWLAPTPDYHEEVAPGQRWLYTHVPFYSQWHRFWIFWRMGDGVLPAVRVDPGWEPKGASVSFENEVFRQLLTAYLEAEVADRPDLLPKVVPTYPVGAKRILRDNGVWAGTLKRDNVRLVTEKITEITPAGVVTGDGEEHEVDVIVYGTGFQASKFLTPMQVRGRGGVDLHELWGTDARAYLGITVPGFPNLFCLYGPNTNIVINGSIVYFSECEVRYALGCLRMALAAGRRAVDCRQEVHDAYNVAVDAENARMAWGASTVNSWYKSDSGRVSQNWPFTLLEFWRRTREPDPADYELLG
jgi:4-hydroxyacetophenone monooxygenase